MVSFQAVVPGAMMVGPGEFLNSGDSRIQRHGIALRNRLVGWLESLRGKGIGREASTSCVVEISLGDQTIFF